MKFSTTDNDEDLSEAKQEQIKLYERRKRRFLHSFFFAENLVQWTPEELSCTEPKNNYQGTTLQYYEIGDKKHLTYGQTYLIKPEVATTPSTQLLSSPDKTRWLN